MVMKSSYFKVPLFLFILTFGFLIPVSAQTPLPEESPLNEKTAVLDSVEFQNSDIAEAFKVLESKSGIIIAPREGVSGTVTLGLQKADVFDVLKTICDMNNLAYSQEGPLVRVMTAADYEREKGVRFTDQRQAKVFRPKFINSLDLAVKLEKIKGPEGKILLTTDGRGLVFIDTPDRILDAESLLMRVDILTETRTFVLKNISGSGIPDLVKKELTPDVGKVKFESDGNQIVVTDRADQLKKIEGLLASLDQPRTVTFEARLAKVLLSEDHEEGVDWAAILANYQAFIGPDQGESARPLCMGTLTPEDYEVLLDALDTVGEVDFFPGPNIDGTHGQKIRVKLNPRLNDVRILTVVPEGEDAKALSTSEYQFLCGLQLFADGQVKTDFVVENPAEKNNPSFQFGAGPQVLVLSGIFGQESVKSVHKFPVLGDIPFLGVIFRRQKTDQQRIEYILFLQIRPGGTPAGV